MPREVAREQLVIAAVNQYDFPSGGFDDCGIALLNIDKINFQNFVALARNNNLG